MTTEQLEKEDFQALALGRLQRVLGTVEAKRIYDETLRDSTLEQLATADDLYAFAKELAKRTGFAGAVGGLLSVAAVMRGAAGKR